MSDYGKLVMAALARVQARQQLRDEVMRRLGRNRRRKPPEAGMPIPAIPPRGPLPKQGGAEAPLEFSDQRASSDLTQAARSTSSPSEARRAST